MVSAHIAYAAAWLLFGLIHSILAADGMKARLRPWLGQRYRLAYNLFATVHILAVLGVGWWLLGDAPAFALPVWVQIGLHALALSGIAIMIAASFGYDGGRFLGLTQWRAEQQHQTVADDEPLRTGGLHRWVRHPIYTGAYLFLWGRALDPLGLATAAWASLYLFLGTLSEERKLIDRYGDAYVRYRAQVPMIFPWKGRAG